MGGGNVAPQRFDLPRFPVGATHRFPAPATDRSSTQPTQPSARCFASSKFGSHDPVTSRSVASFACHPLIKPKYDLAMCCCEGSRAANGVCGRSPRLTLLKASRVVP